jgi:hypothetical protein
MGLLSGAALMAGAVFTAATLFAERPRGITSLRAELVRDAGNVDVQLENLKDVPLEAYALDVYDSKVLIYRQWRDERGFETNGRDHAPIAPHERRIVALGDPHDALLHPSVRVVAAAFTDGTFEGSATERDMMDARRASVAADATYWIAVIDEALSRPPDQIAGLIDRKITERVNANRARHSSYMGGVGSLLESAARHSEHFDAEARAERARLVHLRDELSSAIH